MGGVGGRRSDAHRFYREGRPGPWGKRGHYFRHHSRPGISLEGGQRPVCTGRSPSRPMGGRADRAFVARAGAHHREKLASLAKGYPIATGVIEGACRYLVKDRMEITGARWGLEGGEAVLTLRALVINGDFDAYWAFHESQEYQRNHQAKFSEMPMVRPPLKLIARQQC